MKKAKDITKAYPISQFIRKIRRLADGLEQGRAFTIQIAGERIHVPKGARFSMEHEREKSAEEIEFQITWRPEQ